MKEKHERGIYNVKIKFRKKNTCTTHQMSEQTESLEM